jgi:pimeloyl-ACP methyl ester carboxylesterase
MTASAKSFNLKMPDANIYYETRGSGAPLLMIPGGATDAGIFADLARQLADRYTVFTYDPRGNSRSTFEGKPQEQHLDVHGDDAAKLIKALGDEPTYVFGSSGGAQIGLNLTARYPKLVRVLVAHEPPCVMMLSDPAKALSNAQKVYDIFCHEGVEAAMQEFMANSGMAEASEHEDASPEVAPSSEAMETFARINENLAYFFAHGIMPLSLYRPEVETLLASQSRVVVGMGKQSIGQTTYLTSVALAEKLKTEPIFFPGGHVGYVDHANTFAETLHHAYTSTTDKFFKNQIELEVLK